MGILEGKAIVITGAGRGLGEAYALHAAQSGASVVVNDIDGELAEAVADRIGRCGGRAVASAQSVRDPGQASGVVERCLAEFGKVDGLVNNAALNYEALPWDEDVDVARELIEVNVLGVLYCGIAAARVMRTQRAGSIVNISSGSSFGQRAAGTYAASKGAVASLTYSWALDLAELGVRVNGVCPLAWTRMVERSPAAQLRVTRRRTPDRVAPLVTYLLSDRAEGITGQLIRFTGDQLHIVRQAGIKEPVLHREGWATEDIAAAFDGVLDHHLEPFGLSKQAPPRLRLATAPAE
ncbi:MAG TPA: SDR family oxidoreductase [Pseudonocardiaceae bacterium]|jgi:NAD(P)-dependent dehydrogenase (short-subunit alcohol dehydrogenase family)|nr:SDR family oxidoreductase [Pseudonocardiaceae bacterium]